MIELDRQITRKNADELVESYIASAEVLGDSIAGLKGLRLVEALKRGKAGAGPYPSVSMFEAANRIMTDLVILNGVRWLLKAGIFPFESYSVDYGHEARQDHDIIARDGGETLIGEAFNVSASFFATKRNATLKKLRHSTVQRRTALSCATRTRFDRPMFRRCARASPSCSSPLTRGPYAWCLTRGCTRRPPDLTQRGRG